MNLDRMIEDKTKTVEQLETDLMICYRDAENALERARQAVEEATDRAREVARQIAERADGAPLEDDTHEPDAHMAQTFGQISAHCRRVGDMVRSAESIMRKRDWR